MLDSFVDAVTDRYTGSLLDPILQYGRFLFVNVYVTIAHTLANDTAAHGSNLHIAEAFVAPSHVTKQASI